MRPLRLTIALLVALPLAAPDALARSTAMVDAMQAMARAMTDYFDKRDDYRFGNNGRFGNDRYDNFNRSDNYNRYDNRPRGGEHSDLYILYRSMPGAEPRSAASRTPLLDGIWLGRNGNALLIRDGNLRLFASNYAHYQDAELIVRPPRMTLRSLEGDWEHEFDYAYQNGRLILRGSDGNLLLYRRLEMDRWLP